MATQIDDCLFNYEAVKMAYYTRVNNCLKTKKAGLWTRNKVKESILKIRTYRRKQKAGLPCTPVTIEGTEVDIAKENGVEILILVKDNKLFEVLPCEDCFDVFVDLHLRQSHAGYARMMDVLQTYFYFSSVFLECFVLSCNVCIQQRGEDIKMLQASDKDQEENKCNLLVHITFLDVRSVNVNDDFGFTYVLVYKEMASEYILLRPLKELDPEEVALELYNIFTDFGPPETIQTTHIDFLRVVLDLLKETPIKYYCTISDNQSNNETLRCEVTENINEWMKISAGSNWAMACYTVQYCMNTDKRWPMHQLFGRRIGQRAKVCLSDKQIDTTPAILHPPEEKYAESNVSTSSLHTDEDTDIYIEIKIEPETKIEPESDVHAAECSEVDIDTSSTTEHILFVDPASTATSTSIEEKTENTQGKMECYVCNRVIMFNTHTCNKCKKFIHIFCGLRLAVEPSSFEEFELVCNECKKLQI